MKFIVSRTSDWKGETSFTSRMKQPIEGAKAKKLVSIERKKGKTLDEARRREWGEEFFERGSNHREEDGCVVRDMGTEFKWVVEIPTLKELLHLVSREEREILISKCTSYKGVEWELEIVDSYL